MEATVNTEVNQEEKIDFNTLVADAAVELNISKSEVKTLAQKGKINAELKKDGHRYVNVGEIQTYLTKFEVESVVTKTEKEKAELLISFDLKLTKIDSKLKYISGKRPVNSPFNYKGNKEELYPQIAPYLKTGIATFYDIFAGGGIMSLNVEAERSVYSEFDKNLYNVVNNLSQNSVDKNYQAVKDVIEEHELSKENKNAYTSLTKDFDEKKVYLWNIFYVMMLFSFQNMISYDKKDRFNKGFGVREFNDSLKAKFLLYTDKLIANSHRMDIKNQCYSFINTHEFKENDFVYVDPPYEASDYKYNVTWGEKEEIALLKSLDSLNERGVDFALSNVIKHFGKPNQILIDWVESNPDYNMIYLNKSYADQCSIETEDKTSTEVLITNYKTLNSQEVHEVTMMDSEIVQGRFVVENSIDTNTEVENINKYFNLSEEADKNYLLSMKQALEQKCIGLINKVKVGQELIIFHEKCFTEGKVYKDEFEKQSFGFSLKTANAYMKLARDERITKLTVKDIIKFKRQSLDALYDMTFLTNDEFKLFVNGRYEILKPKRKIDKKRQKPLIKQTDATVKDTLEASNTEIATTVQNEVTESKQKQDNEDGSQASMPNQSAAQTIAELKATIEEQNTVIEKQRAKIERYERLMVGSSMPKYPAQNNIFPRIEDAS